MENTESIMQTENENLFLLKKAILDEGFFDFEMDEDEITEEEIMNMSYPEFYKLCVFDEIEILYYGSHKTEGFTHVLIAWRYCEDGLHPESINDEDDEMCFSDDSPSMLHLRVYSRKDEEENFHLSAVINGWTFLCGFAHSDWYNYYSEIDGWSALSCEGFNILSSMYLLYCDEYNEFDVFERPFIILDDIEVKEEYRGHGLLTYILDFLEGNYGKDFIGVVNNSDMTQEEAVCGTFEKLADKFGWTPIKEFPHDTTSDDIKFAVHIPSEDKYRISYVGNINLFAIFMAPYCMPEYFK